MSKMKSFLAYASFFVICIWLLSCDDPQPKQDNSTVVHSEKNETSKEKINSSKKTDVEKVVNAGKVIIDAGQDLIDKKRKNDSIRISKREKMFAYQLGVPLRGEKLVMEAYERLSDVEGVVALKISRKEYLLIKYEDKDADVLDAALEDYKAEHSAEVIGEIKRIDLMKECGSRKKPVLSDKIKKRKSDVYIDCLTCNN